MNKLYSKKNISKIIVISILSFGLSFGGGAPSDGYNSIRTPGGIIFQTGASNNTSDTIDLADVNDNGEINFAFNKGQEDTTSHRYVSVSQDGGVEGKYDLQTIDGDNLYRISQSGTSDAELQVYNVQKLSNTKKVGDKIGEIKVAPDVSLYNIPDSVDKRYYGVQVMRNSDDEKIFILFWADVRKPLGIDKSTYMLEDDVLVKKYESGNPLIIGQDYDSGKGGRRPSTSRHNGGGFKVRSIPGSNTIIAFYFSYNVGGSKNLVLHAQPYKVNDDGTLTNAGGYNSTINSFDSSDRYTATLIDIQYVNYKGHPGFIVPVALFDTNRTSLKDIFQKSEAFFVEIATSSDKMEDFIIKNDRNIFVFDNTDIYLDLRGDDTQKSQLGILYPYAKKISDDKYETYIASYNVIETGYTSGVTPVFKSLHIEDNVRDSEVYTYKNTDNSFSSLDYKPFGVIFGPPPRYKDDVDFRFASTFNFSNSDSKSSAISISRSNETEVKVGRGVGFLGIGLSMASKQGKTTTDNNKQTKEVVSKDEFSSTSFEGKAGSVIGLKYHFDGLSNFDNKSLGNEAIQIYNLETGQYIDYSNIDLVFNVQNSSPDIGIVDFSLTNPISILDEFAESQTWSELTKGLPEFPETTDVEGYFGDSRANDWYTSAKKDDEKYYTANKVEISTVTQKEAGYILTNENETTTTTEKSNTKEVTVGSSGVKYNISMKESSSSIFKKELSWIFKYAPVEYSKIGKEKVSVDAYVFVPTKEATAEKLPWSSDLMKEQNIKTFAIVYSAMLGI